MIPRGLLKEYAGPLSMLLRVFDAILIVGSGLLAFYFKFGNFTLPLNYQMALLTAALLTILVFSFFHIYESIRSKNFWSYLITLLQGLTTVLVLLAFLVFLTKSGTYFSRTWFMTWAAFAAIILVFCRCLLMITLRTLRSHHWNEKSVVVFATGELGLKLIETSQQALWAGYRIVGIFAEQDDTFIQRVKNIPVYAMPQDIEAGLNKLAMHIDEIWLAMPLRAENKMQQILHQLRHRPVAIRLVLDVFGFGLFNNKLTEIAGFPALNVNATPMVGGNRLLKALEDRLLALTILIVVSPLLVLIALGVKLSSKGPVFFKQYRHGCDGKIIKVYKFRTMYEHQEKAGQVTQATLMDKRITPFGKFLRRTSLDELPQFINVLQGRMSIVGPRPHALAHNEHYKDSIKAYMQRHRVKPGITGWAQVNGWRGETDTLDKMEKRVQYDLYYIEHWSLLFDLKIIFLTFFQGFVNKNAY